MSRVPEYDPTQPQGAWQRALLWLGRQRPMTWFLVNVGNRIDPALMRATGGRVKTSITAPTVLLTYTGAKSGKRYTAPLAYFTDGEDVIVIASAGGAPEHPAWFRSALVNPEVELWAKGSGGRYRAREAEGAERGRLWSLATGFYPGFSTYQQRAGDRRIPVVVCSPAEG